MNVYQTIFTRVKNEKVTEAIKEYGGLYLVDISGAGALCADCICDLEEIAFFDLGCESVKRVTFKNFPLIVAIDSKGKNVYDRDK